MNLTMLNASFFTRMNCYVPKLVKISFQERMEMLIVIAILQCNRFLSKNNHAT